MNSIFDEEQNNEELPEQLPLPLDIFQPKDTIRSEYNIGKWAGIIFASPYDKKVYEADQKKWDIQVDGERMEASLSIIPSLGEKRPTTTTMRVYLALLQAWEYQGSPQSGEVYFSARQLSEVIGWRWGGSETAARIAEHISILTGTKLTWLFSYTNAKKVISEKESNMVILQNSTYFKKSEIRKTKRFAVLHHVQFNSKLVENILHNHVRPINYKQFQKICNDTSANLYTRLDLYLSHKRKWERLAKGLLKDELGLSGKRYEKRYIRLQKLKELVKQLDGVELFNGKLKLSIKESADGTDWKLVALKIPRKEPVKKIIQPVNNDEFAQYLAEEVIEEILRQPQSGAPKLAYIVFLCKLYPENLIRRALATAKADYRGTVKKTLVACFVYEVKRLVQQDDMLAWYKPTKEN